MNEEDDESRIARCQAWLREMHSKEWSPMHVYQPRKIRIRNDMSVSALARLLDLKELHVIRELFNRGIMRTVDQVVERELARTLAQELGFKLDDQSDDNDGSTKVRNPIRPNDSGGSAIVPESPSEEDSSAE